jgi:hypothetical protein
LLECEEGGLVWLYVRSSRADVLPETRVIEPFQGTDGLDAIVFAGLGANWRNARWLVRCGTDRENTVR